MCFPIIFFLLPTRPSFLYHILFLIYEFLTLFKLVLPTIFLGLISIVSNICWVLTIKISQTTDFVTWTSTYLRLILTLPSYFLQGLSSGFFLQVCLLSLFSITVIFIYIHMEAYINIFRFNNCDYVYCINA